MSHLGRTLFLGGSPGVQRVTFPAPSPAPWGCFSVSFWAWLHCCPAGSFQTAQGCCPVLKDERRPHHSLCQPRGGGAHGLSALHGRWGSGPAGARSFASGDCSTVAACLASRQRSSQGHFPCVPHPADPFSGTSSFNALNIPVRYVCWGPLVFTYQETEAQAPAGSAPLVEHRP